MLDTKSLALVMNIISVLIILQNINHIMSFYRRSSKETKIICRNIKIDIVESILIFDKYYNGIGGNKLKNLVDS